VSADGAPAGWPMTVFFDEVGCAGNAYVSWNSVEELVPPTIVHTSGAWAVRPGTTGLRVVRSYRAYDESGPSPDCQAFQTSAYTSEFDYYTLEDLKIVAPLSVQ
jgi:hypothetical protein